MTHKDINVIKRDGTAVKFDIEKVHKILSFACENITGVSISDIEHNASIQVANGTTTQDIHEILIKSASNLVTEHTPNYQYVAARLVNYQLRKLVYNQFEPVPFLDHVKKCVSLNKYDKEILEKYTDQELETLGTYIKHNRDNLFAYAAMEQWRGKYLVQNRVSKTYYETPQMAYMMIGATLFANYPSETRLKYVKTFYDNVSTFNVSLPTPIMAGVRTPTRQFSSCVVINTGDDLNSINATTDAIVKYISKKAGIGVNMGQIRAIGSEINGGDAVHTGLIPFIKYVKSAVKSCSQGGLRGGAATVFFPVWHYEYPELVVLKNNKGTEDNRERRLDYCFQFNGLMYERLINGENISLFSPNDVPNLYTAFCNDQDLFRTLYEKYEKDPNIRKRSIPALEIFEMFVEQRVETGRIYLQNIDHTNTHGSFDEEKYPIYQSNLCVSGDSMITIKQGEVISDIMIKDLGNYLSSDTTILSYDEKTDTTEFMPIEDFAMTKPQAELIKVTDEETGKYIVCTPEHKVLTKNRGYVMAKDLREDDELVIKEGNGL